MGVAINSDEGTMFRRIIRKCLLQCRASTFVEKLFGRMVKSCPVDRNSVILVGGLTLLVVFIQWTKIHHNYLYFVFSGRELAFTFAICDRRSVCLSSVVCL